MKVEIEIEKTESYIFSQSFWFVIWEKGGKENVSGGKGENRNG